MPRQDVLGRIESIFEELPKAEKKIAQVILETPERVITMTASQLGQEACSSAATVMRLCKRIGVPSFTQLKVMVSGEISRPEPVGYSDFTADEPVEDIMEKLLSNAFHSMQETLSILDKKKLLEAVEALEKATVIYIFGVGASNLVAQNIAQKWSRAGKICVTTSDAHNLIASMTGQRENVVFVGISNSGETREVLKLLDFASENNYTTIGLTRFGKNSVSSKADIPLQTVRANEEELRSAATSSLHAQFMVVDVLFFTYASRNYQKVMENISHSRRETKEYGNA